MALQRLHIFCVCLIILPFPTIAQTNQNIPLGSSLQADEPTSSWTSPSKHFAFGFQEIEPGDFLLAIWFDQIPERTITWSANRDHPVPSGSKVELTTDKGLVLTDPSGNEIWRKLPVGNTTGPSIAYAAMLDTGNFVLATQASAILWQSFDEPTDTLLPTQTLNLGGELLARFSEKNYSGGRFTFILQATGDLALYTTKFPLFNELNSPYWDSDTAGVANQVVFNQSGFLYHSAENGSNLTAVFSDGKPEKQLAGLYQRVILEYDGVLRHYVYLNKSSSLSPSSQGRGWSTKAFAPENICTAVMQQTGPGVCGYNAYCKIGNEVGKPHCLCPPGYKVSNPHDELSACVDKFPSQSCGKDEFDFKELRNVDWPLSDSEKFVNVTIDWCKEACLGDCNCAVAIFRKDGHCWMKMRPLSNGRYESQQ